MVGPGGCRRIAPALGRASGTGAAGAEAAAWLATDALDERTVPAWRDPAAAAHTLAFLQYTSGSTDVPRSVMISHGNLLHNLAYAFHRARERPVVRVGLVAPGRPRHGADRRRPAARLQRVSGLPDVADRVPAATGPVAAGDFAVPGDP